MVQACEDGPTPWRTDLSRAKVLAPPEPPQLRRRIGGVYTLLIASNLAAWAWAVLAFRGNPMLLGLGFLAWGFGLRHAVDADHIAAIDNVTRKLMQEGKRPVTVGLFFALGHSSVVVIIAALVGITAATMQARFGAMHDLGGIIGTLVSALFLFLIAGMNIVILRDVWRSFNRLRRGEPIDRAELDGFGAPGGLLARLFRPLFRLVSSPAWMLPLGFLFGLGFDTATEVSLLSISAAQGAHGMSLAGILVFPALFAAGMCLVDTTDGILMLGAYEWAFLRPARKLYYNLTITFVSVMVAVLVGGIETLGLVADQLGMTSGVWGVVGKLDANFNNLGFGIIALFAVSWAVSILIYKLKDFDSLDKAPSA